MTEAGPFDVRGSRVEVTREGLLLNGDLSVARHEVHSGILRHVDGLARVTVRARDGRQIVLEIPRLDDGRAILRALGVDGSSMAMTFEAKSPTTPFKPWFFVMTAWSFFVASLITPSHWLPLGAVVPLMAYVLHALRTDVTVGVDAVLIRWLAWQRVIPIRSIVSLHATSSALAIRDGARVTRIRTRAASWNAREGPELAARRDEGGRRLALDIEERINEAKLGMALEEGDDASLPDRGDRSFREWVAELRALASRQGFREQPFAPERLWRVAESARSEPMKRVAAAIALAPTLDARGKERLRVVAARTVFPRLRIALRCAAAGDDARTLPELAAVEAEASRK